MIGARLCTLKKKEGGKTRESDCRLPGSGQCGKEFTEVERQGRKKGEWIDWTRKKKHPPTTKQTETPTAFSVICYFP